MFLLLLLFYYLKNYHYHYCFYHHYYYCVYLSLVGNSGIFRREQVAPSKRRSLGLAL